LSPDLARAAAVTRITSGLVEVDTTGPVAARIAGMMTEDVFPDRGGPKTSTELSGAAH
jgi:hypothetical protein